MKFTLLYSLPYILQISGSRQAALPNPPSRSIAGIHDLQSHHLPLPELVQRKPDRLQGGVGTAFLDAFAQHPHIAHLDTLTQNRKDYIKKTLELRKLFKDDGKARAKFRTALVNHMQAKGVSNQLIGSVKSRFASAGFTESTIKAKNKAKEQDPEGFERRRKQHEATFKQKEAERKAKREQEPELSFAERLVAAKVPKDADANQIEEASREFRYDGSARATWQLHHYLEKKNFSKEDIATALSRRTFHLRNLSYLRRPGRSATQSSAGPLAGQKRIRNDTGGAVSEKKSEGSTSSRVTSESASSLSSQPVSASPPVSDISTTDAGKSHKDILHGGNQFEDTEWWNDL